MVTQALTKIFVGKSIEKRSFYVVIDLNSGHGQITYTMPEMKEYVARILEEESHDFDQERISYELPNTNRTVSRYNTLSHAERRRFERGLQKEVERAWTSLESERLLNWVYKHNGD